MATTPSQSLLPSARAIRSVTTRPFMCWIPRVAWCVGVGAGVALSAGCEVDSWFDPSRTGYFEHTPTSIPILRRIDVIEVETEPFATEVGAPRNEDLVYGNSEYQFGYGDVLEIQINELFQEGKPEGFRRTVDQAGKILLPVVGQIDVTGLTHMQVVQEISDRLKNIIPNPEVDVQVVEARNYTFTVIGDVRNPGLYTLSRPDFDVVDAVALAGGADQGTKRIRIIRVIPDTSLETTPSNEAHGHTPSTPVKGSGPSNPVKPADPQVPAASIDDLINQISPATPPATVVPPAEPGVPPVEPTAPPAEPTAPPSQAPQPIEPPAPPQPIEPAPPSGHVSPNTPALGAVRPSTVAVDGEPLQVPATQDKSVVDPEAAVLVPPKSVPSTEDQYVFDTQKQEWILVPASQAARMERVHQLAEPNSPDGAITGELAATASASALKPASEFRLPSGQKTRIIEIDWASLKSGNLMLNAIVRPEDKLYVEVEAGVVYIDGEVARPGVYSLPAIGDLTLSRLVAAAGGLGQIAIPQRVDLIRKIAPDREANIRVNLAAIRNRAEPDIQLRADDHVIIGTNFIATPLAVIRNGFRMTYGFGFLLDRNFGNDVFGAPPTNIVGN